MKLYITAILIAALFTACSEDERAGKTNEPALKVEKKVNKSADKKGAIICLDEDDKITCKLMADRINRDRDVEFIWKSPDGKDDRERATALPANHASTYDVRYKKGRAKGEWSVTAAMEDEEVSTTFTIR